MHYCPFRKLLKIKINLFISLHCWHMFKELLDPCVINLETFKNNYAGSNRPYTLSAIFASFVPKTPDFDGLI